MSYFPPCNFNSDQRFKLNKLFIKLIYIVLKIHSGII